MHLLTRGQTENSRNESATTIPRKDRLATVRPPNIGISRLAAADYHGPIPAIPRSPPTIAPEGSSLGGPVKRNPAPRGAPPSFQAPLPLETRPAPVPALRQPKGSRPPGPARPWGRGPTAS